MKIRELHTLSESLARKQPIYIGKSMDQIDLSLADFLNMYPEREDLKILFVRESEGVYKFGQKRVYVKIEKGNQIFVKVGGGFMNVKEFIDKYTPLEIEKIQRNSVSARYNKKLQIQKISSRVSQGSKDFAESSSPKWDPYSRSGRQSGGGNSSSSPGGGRN